MKLKLAFLLSVLVIINKSQGQTPSLEVALMQFQSKQVIPPGPEAAELGKYGNVPVSLYTGTPNISVPLTALTGSSLSLSLSLSYNASGYKPQDVAPWVGSGWSLNAGGVITRSVMGNPDNASNYFGSSRALNPPSSNYMFPYYAYMDSLQEGTVENQPDVYYYNFAGHSGKFFLKPDQSVLKKEKDLKKIIPCMVSCSTPKFTIIDEQGNTYIFDSVETTRSVPTDALGQLSYITYEYVSTWYLSHIFSADGSEQIDFEYYPTSSQIIYDGPLTNRSVTFQYGVKGVGTQCALIVASESAPISQVPPVVSIKRKFLKKITLKKNTEVVAYIDFHSTAGVREDSDFAEDRLLNSVKLYSTTNGSNQLIKQFNLGYGYFEGNSQSYPSRLRLDSLTEIGNDSGATSKPPYLFSYNTNTALPDRFTTGIDHWGYFNTATSNSSLVPDITFEGRWYQDVYFVPRSIGDGANRDPDYTGSAAFVLNKVQYPTGGYTAFEYEINHAKFVDNSLHNVGGIRVRQIIDYSFENKVAVKKNYEYTNEDGNTSGVSHIYPNYVTEGTYINYFRSHGESTCEAAIEKEDYELKSFTVSANSIYGLGSFQGSPIGYTRVTEYQSDLATDNPLGKTVYKFNAGLPTEHNDDIASGDLLEESIYDNAGKLLSQKTNTYTTEQAGTINYYNVKSDEVQTNKNNYCVSGGVYIPYGYWQNAPSGCDSSHTYSGRLYLSGYQLTGQNKRLLSQTQKIYDQNSNNYVFTKKKYTYNSTHNYPVLIEDSTSNGEKIVTTVKYAIDYDTTTVSSTFANNIKNLVLSNLPGTPIEKLQYRLYTDSSKKYLSGQLTDYELSNPVKIYFLESNPPLTSVTPSAITSGNLTYDSHYRLAGKYYYYFGNLEHQSKTNDVIKSYLWDYNYQYPIAEVQSINLGDTVVQGPHGNLLLIRTPLLSYTSFETGYKGGLSFSGTPQTESTSPTGKRCYSLGNGSISAGIVSNTVYILSYWRNSASAYTVSGSTSVKQGGTHNGWTYFEHTVTGVSTSTISGSGLIDEVRVYPKTSLMTTYTYDPLIGVTTQCDVSNQITYYEYDGLNRLKNVKDDDRNIVKNYKYNYGPGSSLTASATTLYYNLDTTGIFIKSGCTGGRIPDTVAYKIGYGKYASVVSQAHANEKARADIIVNGQAYANMMGGCYFRNVTQPTTSYDNFFKNNCTYAQGPGNSYRYEVPAGKYKSDISQTDANNLALAEITANGQTYANANAGCSCDADNQQYIGGSCLTSSTKLYYGGYRPDPENFPTTWICIYRYSFNGTPGDKLLEETIVSSNGCPENN